MNAPTPLPDWSALATLADEEVPLLRSALLIARDEYPDLDVAACEAQIDAHAEALRDAVAAIDEALQHLLALCISFVG